MPLTLRLKNRPRGALKENLENALAHLSPDLRGFRIAGGVLRLDVAEGCDAGALRVKARRLIRLLRPVSSARPKIVFNNARRKVPFRQDVYRMLVGKREIIESGPGLFSLHGGFLRLVNSLDARLRAFAKSLGAREALYPVSIPIATLNKSRHFTAFPQQAVFMAPLIEDMDVIAGFSEKIRRRPLLNAAKYLSPPRQICAPACCLHCYASFENEVFGPGRSECVTTAGRVFRNEGSRAEGLERLNEYGMREIIFIGSRRFVAKGLGRCLRWCRDFMKAGGLQGVIQTAADPFFAANAAQLQFFAGALEDKLEMRLLNPFTGRSLAAASINNHRTHFSKAYGIRSAGGDYVRSGCVGFGLERLAFLILSQHGLDPSTWPAGLKKR